MKHKLLNKLLFLTLLTWGGVIINPAWADDVVVTFTSSSDVGTGTSASGNNSVSKGGITISCNNGGFAIDGGAHYRWAKSSTTTISSSVGNIKSIVINGPTGTGDYSMSKFGLNTGWTLDSSKGTYTWTGDATSVSVTARTAQVRPTSIVVTYTPSVTTYTITKSTTNGTISAKVSSVEVTSAEEDATVTIEATPDTGYSFSSWSVTKTTGGEAVSVTSATTNPATFTMPGEPVTVSASFTKNSHVLDLTTDHGTCVVTVDGDDWDGSSAIEYGANVEITATPSSGYLFNAWDHTLTSPTISGNVISFSMPDEDVAIEAQYIDASSVKSITISDAIEHGTVTVSANTAIEGDIIELTATPDDGYAFSAWDVRNDDTNAAIVVESDLFEMPDADVTVSATFSEVVAESVSLDITSTTIYLGFTTATLTATVSPSNVLNKTVTWESSDEDVATVINGVVTPVALGTATITVKTANNKTATCAVTVATAPKGSQYNPFTCTEAIAAYDVADENVNSKYVKGIVTKISGSNYWISDDGVVNNEQFECFNGKQEDGTTSINSTYLNVGDVVVASGNITKYSSTYELASGNVVYSKTRPVVTITRNNNDYGTASLTARTITATPADDYRVAAGAAGYTITSGEATVENNGDNTFSLSGIWADCTIQVNFEAIPTHTVTFVCNGITVSTTSVAEGGTVTFPTAVATPSAGQIPETFNGKTFVGWVTAEYSHATDAPSYASTTMGTSDVTYYAVYADVSGSACWVEATLASMISTDVFVFASGSYAMKNDGGTSGSPKPASITVSEGKITSTVTDAMKWKVSGNSTEGYIFLKFDDTTKWLYCNTTASSSSNDNLRVGTGNRKLWVYSGSYLVTHDEYTARYLSMNGTTDFRSYVNTNTNPVTPTFYKYQGPTYANFTTDARAAAGISFAEPSVDAKLTSGYTGQALTNPNSLTVAYSSSEETVATVNSSTGVPALLKAGTTTITASFAGNATYKPAVVNYVLNVTEKTPHGLAYATAEVAKLTTDATFTNTLTNDNSLTVSYTSSTTGVATVNASTGEVTIKGAGSATITATFAGNEDYEAGSASYTLTVSKATPTLEFASADAIGRIGEAFAGNTLNNPASLTVSYESSDETVATINASTGAITGILKAGTTTITASFDGDDTYVAGSASFTLKVLANPTITVSDDEIAWGEKFTVDDSDITGGAITVTSGNTKIATVEGLVITPVSCGTVTITVSTAENDDYRDGLATFDLTINAPEGKTIVSEELIATFDFTDNGDWDIPTSETSTTTSYDNGIYEITLAGAHYFQSTNKYLMLKGSTGVLTFPEFDKKVTKIEVVGRDGASASTKENIYVGSTAVSSETTGSTGINIFAINSNYQDVGTIYSLKVTDKNAQITSISVYTEPSATVKLNKYGYATYCSVNPIDFSSTTGYTAWRVSNIAADGTITFTKITEKIKGGQGVLLYNKDADGENTSDATITFADGSTEFTTAQNKLVGTTAPTYLTQEVGANTLFGLSGSEFAKVAKEGATISANKAYLPVPTSIVEGLIGGGGGEVKGFTFVFDDIEDGIRIIENVSPEDAAQIFDLSGRRLSKIQKGINIVNGKKVLY